MERIADVTSVTFSNVETGEEIELDVADDDARASEVIVVTWDERGVLTFEP